MKKSLGLFQHNHKTVKRRTAVKRKKNDYNDRRYKRDEYEDDDIEDDDRYDERDEDDDRYDERDEDDDRYDERDEDDDRYDERDEDDDRYDERDEDDDRYDERYEDDYYDEQDDNDRNDDPISDDYYDDGYDDYDEDEDEDYEDQEEYHSRKQSRGKSRKRKGKVLPFLKNANAMERVALLAGGIVIAVGVSVGTIFVQAQARNREIASFKNVGSQLNGVQVIGQSGLLAVADAQQAKMAASDAVSDAADSASTEDANAEVRVRIALATIKKDLKIKFINRENGKLVANVPFTIKVEGPKGTDTYNDDDMDGIIYKSDIPAGTYTVTAQPLDSKYDRYEISTDAQKIAVKDTITYKKVDVKDEIKTEAQVNVAKEDTQVQNTPVESVKKDTVEWVESTKTEVGTDDSTTAYSAIDKSTITDPSASAKLNIKGLSRFDGVNFSVSGASAMTVNDEQTLTVSGNQDGGTVTWSSDNSAVSVDGNGNVKAVSEGKATVTAIYSYKEKSLVSKNVSTTVKDANGNESATTATTTESVSMDKNISATISITVSKKAEAATYSLTPATASVAVGGTVQLTASSTNLSDTKVAWSSANTSVATVSDTGLVTAGKTAGTAVITAKYSDGTTKTTTITVTEYTITSVSIDKSSITVGGTATLTAVTDPTGGTVTWTCDKTAIATIKDKTVTGVSAGTATLTATCGSSTKTLTLTVTSDKGAVTLSPTKLTLLVGKTSALTAAVTDMSDKTVTWASSDSSVATVSSAGKVSAVKAGTATITATSSADKSKTATCAVTVVDSASVLKDKNGNTVYILDKNGKYVQATYADYYTASKFYVQTAGKKYKYTGWQTIDGKTYFYDKDGNVVTGEQTIQGAKYTFGSDGVLQTGSGNMGIDVSKWNGNIDWVAVKNSGVSFVIIRCGYRGSSTGALIEDPKFRTNIKGATNAGIKVGVYFFTQAISDVEAVEEASMVADLCSGYSLSYPVYLDVEGSNGRGDTIDTGTRTAVCKAFCATMANAGYGTGVYANKTWLTSRINTASLTGYKIWLAQYAANPTYSATRYDMWQYTSKGSVTGITGKVDLNICY